MLSGAASGPIKGWTPEEDAEIVALVGAHGIKKWSIVAAGLPGRNGKQVSPPRTERWGATLPRHKPLPLLACAARRPQCRERWHNQLDPSIKKEQWTEEEDRILLQAFCPSCVSKCVPACHNFPAA